MKKLNIFLAALLLLVGLNACDDNIDDGSGLIICPEGVQMVQAFAVDYTTNKFLGGYDVILPGNHDDLFELVSDFNPPGDFGNITWYDKATEKKVFAGTIIWMGKGEQTFPEKLNPASSFVKLQIKTKMPELIPIYNQKEYEESEPIDYNPIWSSISSLQSVSWLTEDSNPVYIYLYAPSVGIGDPKDWYWIIFMRYG